jgi:hypothetical protein
MTAKNKLIRSSLYIDRQCVRFIFIQRGEAGLTLCNSPGGERVEYPVKVSVIDIFDTGVLARFCASMKY